jgi:uroporphyrin-III C-methyltransferase / precorrin-2 dehydrogenase / sirohydrochlorin ferrochelatase
MLPGPFSFMADLLPLFLNLAGRDVLLVGGGPVAGAKLRSLLLAGAHVRVVAPEIGAAVRSAEPAEAVESAGAGAASDHDVRASLVVERRAFEPSDLDGAWLVIAAATPAVNRQVAEAAESRRVFVNAVDDPANATAFLSGVVRRGGVTLAISTSGDAPALTALIREALDELLPADLDAWLAIATDQRPIWRREGVPMDERKPRLLQALNERYNAPRASPPAPDALVPWLNGPEDSWL